MSSGKTTENEPTILLLVLALSVMAAAFVGAVAAGFSGYMAGYALGVSDAQLFPTHPPPEVIQQQDTLWLEQFGVLDAMARKARPSMPDPERQWLVLQVLISSYRHGVDPKLAMSVAIVESRLDSSATGRKGEAGVMQLMPRTAWMYGLEDPYEAQANIDAGVRYLAELLKRYNGNVTQALIHYNGGTRALRSAPLKLRVTRNYVTKVRAVYAGR